MKRMLINATQPEELRVAIVNIKDNKLIDLILERPTQETKTGNIYFGTISSVEPSLEAAFVNFGSERHGFLPFKEVANEYYQTSEKENDSNKSKVSVGQHVMIQVDKEERGNKGAALTTFVSLAGSYLVLMPNNPRAGGISRRIEGDERDHLREQINELKIPENMGVIIRTAGVGKSAEELQWDLEILLKQWEAIKGVAGHRAPPFLIHQESDVFTRTLRDYFREDVTEIIVDNPEIFEKTRNYLQTLRNDYGERVKLHQQTTPVFNYHQIEHQIETAYLRELRLPSGGSIVIDRTEALVSIDINSARATRGTSIEETALNTNIEAAEEIARQLRLRDLGGLIVIDFIDMNSIRNQREVESKLREALKLDRARVQIGRISRFGLLEMSRQRLRRSLSETTQEICPRCGGRGTIRGVESLALTVLRVIEEEAMKPRTAQVQAQLPIDVATYLLNEKRDLIISLEQRHQPTTILIIPNQYLQTPSYRIRRIQGSGTHDTRSSYKFISGPEIDKVMLKAPHLKSTTEEPAVKSITPSTPSPASKEQPGLIKRLWTAMFTTPEKKPASAPSQQKSEKQPSQRPEQKNRNNQRRQNTNQGKQRQSNSNKRRQPNSRPRQQNQNPNQNQNQNKGQQPQSTVRSQQANDNKKSREPRPEHSTRKPQKPPQPKSPEHLPPFPDDLESYYQEARSNTQQPAKKSAEKPTATNDKKPNNQDSVTETNPKTTEAPVKSREQTTIEQPGRKTEIKSSLDRPQQLKQIETKSAPTPNDEPVIIKLQTESTIKKETNKDQQQSTIDKETEN